MSGRKPPTSVAFIYEISDSMSKILFEPGSPTFNELVGNGKIHDVPKYQRDYSWSTEDWDDLWNDLEGIPDEQIHYMGYVVLQRTADARRHWIIDGQQRITTLSILALAALDLLRTWAEQGIEAEANMRRIKILENNFVAVETASSLTPMSKLNLNRNNDDFYKSYLLRRRKPASMSRFKPSEQKMWQAYAFFKQKFQEKFDARQNGEAVAAFLEKTVGDKLVFSSITVGDDLNAYKVFETLNARGVKLSTGDLLKNYLLSEVAKTSEHDLDEAERMWQSINDALQKTDLPTFIRHYWNSRYPLQTKTTLFKAIKNEIKGIDKVFELLGELEELAVVYAALDNSASDIWTADEKESIEELNLFSASQCYTLMLSAYKNIRPVKPEEFVKILKQLVVVTFRYTTISQYNANIIEQEFNKTSLSIARGDCQTAREVFHAYEKALYLNDDVFANNFTHRALNTNRFKTLTRYILCKLERQLSGVIVDWNDARLSIEHILPENPGPDWEGYFTKDEQEEYVFRLGNLTLMETGKNRDVGNKLIGDKLPVYQTSQYALTRDKTAYTEWKPSTVQKRQSELAKLAKTVWKVN
jgi:uncharacterized protein with ParB-like and HNH nuclease domain